MTRVLAIVGIGFMMGVLSLSLRFKHLLNILIRLEFSVLSVFIIFMAQSIKETYYFGFVFLIFRVCEGALGLSLLVAISRSFGGDYFQILGLSY